MIYLIILLLVGCSTSSHLDKDASSPNYHDPSANMFHHQEQDPHETSGDTAVAAAGIAAMFSKDYYKSSSIGGECKFKDPASAFALPCHNVMVFLTDTKGAELFRKQTDDNGDFSFPVQKGKLYVVKIPASKSFLDFKSGPLEMGQKIWVNLAVAPK